VWIRNDRKVALVCVVVYKDVHKTSVKSVVVQTPRKQITIVQQCGVHKQLIQA